MRQWNRQNHLWRRTRLCRTDYRKWQSPARDIANARNIGRTYTQHILADNDQLAEHNQEHFNKSRTFSLNFMSAPGAGKTSLIEKSLPYLLDKFRCSVIEGDMVGE